MLEGFWFVIGMYIIVSYFWRWCLFYVLYVFIGFVINFDFMCRYGGEWLVIGKVSLILFYSLFRCFLEWFVV